MSGPEPDDTGRRCPRCDCADDLPQCEHCKVCPHGRQAGKPMSGPYARPECGGEVHTDPWGAPIQCPRSCPQTAAGVSHDAHQGCGGWMPDDGTHPEAPPAPTPLEEAQATIESLRYQIRRAREALAEDEPDQTSQIAELEGQIERVRKVVAERRAEVAEREADGMLPFGTPGASWCDAVTVTCARIDDALRVFPPPVAIRDATSDLEASEQPEFVIALHEDDGALIIGIHPDGQITTGPNYQPDAAAREFWDAVTRAAQAANPWPQAATSKEQA